MSRTEVEFRESHITDGIIAVDVRLEGESIGTAYVDLPKWDRLKGTHYIVTRNRAEAEAHDQEEAQG